MTNYELFLGGHDAEMKSIESLAKENGVTVYDSNLGWGAKASAYIDQILKTIADGKTPVLVELINDLPGEISEKVKWVDHHNERAGEEASIFQVSDLIGSTRSRSMRIIAANDVAYIPGMIKEGATTKEIDEIRRLDRGQQGVTDEMERQSEDALKNMERYPELSDLIIVRIPHSKSSPVTDRLYGQQIKQNILILAGNGEVNYFGDGVLCATLKEKFQGWCGGSGLGKAGETAFWGGYPNQEEVSAFIKINLSDSKNA
jgi:hypothetical protein